MGQQQLILLVLATVIVGVAIVIGIRAFTENSIRANSDAMIQDMVRMASDAQAWKQKPAPFGGQDDTTTELAAKKADVKDYAGINWVQLGYPETTVGSGVYQNLNGVYKVDATSATALKIIGLNVQKKNYVEITVDGIGDRNIKNTDLDVGTSTATALPS